MSTKYGYLSPQAQRRIQAGELILKGYGNNDIAEILEVSSASVCRWRTLIKEAGGLHGLARKQGSGQSSTLTDEQSAELKEILNEGAVRAGYPVDRWTSKIVSDLIGKKFKIKYAPRSVRRWMKNQGLSYQKSTTRSHKHSQEKVEHWIRYTWPRLKKNESSRYTPSFIG